MSAEYDPFADEVAQEAEEPDDAALLSQLNILLLGGQFTSHPGGRYAWLDFLKKEGLHKGKEPPMRSVPAETRRRFWRESREKNTAWRRGESTTLGKSSHVHQTDAG